MTAPTTRTLEVPGAVLTYDVRPSDASDPSVLLLIGSPMAANGFVTLAGHLTDRTVVTYDPRGVERSTRTDGATESTPDEHADDLHRLIEHVRAHDGASGGDGPGAGAVDVFASSGGAVNALVLVARHPDQVRTLVAHEPPVVRLLPDRVEALAACRDVHDTYRRSGLGPAMAKFIALVSLQGPVPADLPSRPVDPAAYGLPTEDDGSRDDPLVGQNILSGTHHEHDLDAVRAASTRVVVAVGEQSGGELARRAGEALADRLGTAPVELPGGHGGFLGDEYGRPGEPEAFARRLREVLAGG